MQTSSVEIERVCDQADESILETAAISVSPAGGGPEVLVIFVVLKKGFTSQPVDKLKMIFSKAIQRNLNPLFKVFMLLTFIFSLEVHEVRTFYVTDHSILISLFD